MESISGIEEVEGEDLVTLVERVVLTLSIRELVEGLVDVTDLMEGKATRDSSKES